MFGNKAIGDTRAKHPCCICDRKLCPKVRESGTKSILIGLKREYKVKIWQIYAPVKHLASQRGTAGPVCPSVSLPMLLGQ